MEKYHEIPWRAIVSLRNIISHEYANVDEEIVFQVIKPKSVIRLWGDCPLVSCSMLLA